MQRSNTVTSRIRCSILLDKWRNAQGKYFCSATGGADSGPASLEATPTGDKNGQQAFSAGKFCDINMDIFNMKIDGRISASRNYFECHLHYCYARLERLFTRYFSQDYSGESRIYITLNASTYIIVATLHKITSRLSCLRIDSKFKEHFSNNFSRVIRNVDFTVQLS